MTDITSTRDVVVVKWGGGLITDKRKMCTPNESIISMLAQTILPLHKENIDVILVHGAGSFGHLRAKTWRLNEGYLGSTIWSFQDDASCSNQFEAVEKVQQDMLDLNRYVSDALTAAGIPNITFSPHLWVTGVGVKFAGDLTPIRNSIQGRVVICHGDVVPVDGEQKFGILSGDDLVVRLCLEMPNVKRLVFAIGGVDGLLRYPPKPDKDQFSGPLDDENDVDGSDNDSNSGSKDDALIEVWSPDVTFDGSHDIDIDVTGGIGLKAARGAYVVKQAAAAKRSLDVILVNGQSYRRVLGACLGTAGIRGTYIVEKPT